MKRGWRRVLLLLGILLASGCSRHAGGQGEDAAGHSSEATVPVRVASVETRSFASTVVAPGQWRSSGELVLSAPFAGVLETLGPHVGDRVGDGEAVGTLVTRETWSALHGAELMLREAHDDAARTEAQRAIALARRDLVRVPITAPQAGIVVRRSLEPGAQPADGAEVLALVPSRNVVFEAHVPAERGASLKLGQSADVSDPNHPARSAVVQRILPTANSADQSLLVWLSPRSTADASALDRYGTARIVVGPPHRASAVPDSALVEDDLTGARQVAVVDKDGRMGWMPVELGAAESGWHEVVKPALAPGTRVVVEGQRGLPDGTHVKWEP
jgi:multidrug efflux pump subunit AcrA (membrane-fusion protein)